MDSILKEFFGVGADEPEAPPAAAQAAPAAADQPVTDRQAALDAQREARRAARQQRKADPDRRRQRDEFVDRYTTGHPAEGFTAEEAIDHIREMREELSPAEFRKAMEQTLGNLPVDQRDEFIALMRQHKAGAGQAAPAAAAAASAAAAGTAAVSADPFGGLLTGLLGGGGGAASGAGGVDVGALLSDLQKGGLSAPAAAGGGQPSAADFAALINSPLGKAVLGGLAAYGMKGMQGDDDDHDTPGGARSRG